jgi:undecaprenyl-diphosphatase
VSEALTGVRAEHAESVRVPRANGLLITGILLLIVLAIQALLVAANPAAPWTQSVDDAWRALVGVGPDSGVHTGPPAMFFQYLGELPGFAVMFIPLPAVLTIVGRWRSALFVIAVQLAGPGLVSQLIKNLVNRPRPATDAAAGLYGPLFTVDHGSFPSGHAVSAAAIAITVFALIPPTRRRMRVAWGVVGALLMIGIVWQRTLINAHWLSDTISGLIAGTGVALVLWWAFQPWLRRDYGRRPGFLGSRP